MKKSIKVYVACAITHVPSEQKSAFALLLKEVKKELNERGYTVIDFLSAVKENPEAKEVYNYDIECLKSADCLLALGDYPGTGLGYEIGYTTEFRKIPTMVGVSDPNNISKLLKGVSQDNYKFAVFSKADDLVETFINFVSNFYEKNN